MLLCRRQLQLTLIFDCRGLHSMTVAQARIKFPCIRFLCWSGLLIFYRLGTGRPISIRQTNGTLVFRSKSRKKNWKLSAHVQRKLNLRVSKMLSRSTGGSIANGAWEPTLEVLMRAMGRLWNSPGHVLLLKERNTASSNELCQANAGCFFAKSR